MLEVQQVQSSTPLLNGSTFNPSTKDFIESFGERSPSLSSLRSEALACLPNSYSVLKSKGCILGSDNLVSGVKNNSNQNSTPKTSKPSKQQNLPYNWWECPASEGWKKQITDLFIEYLSSTEDKAIVLFNADTDTWVSIPYLTRFQKKYLRKVSKRLSNISIASGYFLTLTIDPKCFTNIIEASKDLNIAWNRLKSALQKKYGKGLKFLRVLEFGTGKRKGVSFENATHLPHLHIVISGITYLDYDWLQSVYPYRIEAQKIRGSVDLNSYVSKYVRKGLCVDYTDNLLYPALYWLTNCRLYSVSRGLLPPFSPHVSSGVWEYLGVYTLSSTDRIGEYIAQWKKSPPSFDLHEYSVYWNSIYVQILRAWANEDKRYLGVEKRRKPLPYGGGAVHV